MLCRKEYQANYRLEKKVQLQEYRTKNRTKQKEIDAKRVQDFKQHAIYSISSGRIIDRHKWDLWCNRIKKRAQTYPYSDDFTNDIIFEMMILGCFYCGDIATTIDRLDSSLGHTPENCMATCWGCNNSKGGSDPSTFLKKAYYRVRNEYYDDDTDIWFVNKNKPTMYEYEYRAKKKGVVFELTRQSFDVLIKGDCAYCKRSPVTWVGIDRVVPSIGYTIDNSVSCCWDCNRDKHEEDVETMIKRNERIASRVDARNLIIYDCERTVLHNGTQKSSKKICAYGKVYQSKSEASRALGKGKNYVCNCIRDGRHTNDIFEIFDKQKYSLTKILSIVIHDAPREASS